MASRSFGRGAFGKLLFLVDAVLTAFEVRLTVAGGIVLVMHLGGGFPDSNREVRGDSVDRGSADTVLDVVGHHVRVEFGEPIPYLERRFHISQADVLHLDRLLLKVL